MFKNKNNREIEVVAGLYSKILMQFLAKFIGGCPLPALLGLASPPRAWEILDPPLRRTHMHTYGYSDRFS